MHLRPIIITVTLVILAACAQQAEQLQSKPTEGMKNDFNAALAQELGADDYGMSRYVIAFLYAGENREPDSTKAAELQSAHLKNIRRMAEEGSLVLAGPFLNDGELRGIYIFDVATIEEAQALTETDPAIQAGSLRMELLPWYGSAAIKEVSETHERIQKVKF
ncbi:MAG: YciI family protein [Candidatus Marinimicrobia bacterium]|nr:YciI family protein [Candidatus Neomarinimicrobiota bacterium]MCF7850715.1 YciI family protein [Candidatus Neomarinimicrobiota bacterium]MCF7904916.1 YciI family protein [Candidatus Neomarinimicrobiota bacterium]